MADYPYATEEEQLIAWRYRQLRAAGSDRHYAQVLAERVEIDLHKAVELLEHGCSPGTTAAILL